MEAALKQFASELDPNHPPTPISDYMKPLDPPHHGPSVKIVCQGKVLDLGEVDVDEAASLAYFHLKEFQVHANGKVSFVRKTQNKSRKWHLPDRF